ncbi:unnamed protein product [marine sediment metagenome]|uniref:Uncharacterized protein n=1 Tax=marine sediment metagenome TaxID=412755 RepID=X0WSE6_9ZZZZ
MGRITDTKELGNILDFVLENELGNEFTTSLKSLSLDEITGEELLTLNLHGEEKHHTKNSFE